MSLIDKLKDDFQSLGVQSMDIEHKDGSVSKVIGIQSHFLKRKSCLINQQISMMLVY